MQNFNNEKGIRRLITINAMTLEQAQEYYYSLFYREPKEKQVKYTENLEKRIKELAQKKNQADEWILAISTKEGKLIGKMEIYSSDSVTASLKIEIPNELKSFHYGIEAVKQFRKICEENHYFERIDLESNLITERYKKAYGIDSDFIEIRYA